MLKTRATASAFAHSPAFTLVRNKADLEDSKFMTFGRPREGDYMPGWWNSIR